MTTYFITGAEGVGKTSIIPYLKGEIKNLDIHDFDEMGVSDNPPLQWRLDTTLHWIKKAIANQNKGRSTCIIGLCFPSEVADFEEVKMINEIIFLLLDVSQEERSKRLHKRNTSWMSDYNTIQELRGEFNKTKYKTKIIDTSKLSITETAEKVSQLIMPINKS